MRQLKGASRTNPSNPTRGRTRPRSGRAEQRQTSAVRSGSLALALLSSACQNSQPSGASGASGASSGSGVSGKSLSTVPALTDFVVLVENSVRLREGATIRGADVGVIRTGPGPVLGDARATVGQGVRIDPSNDLAAESVRLRQDSVVGDIFTSSLVGSGESRGAVYPFPASMPTLPPAGTVTAGSQPISLAQNVRQRLAPGAYGAVLLRAGSVLELDAGSFDLAELNIGEKSRIEALGPVELRIAGRLLPGSNCFIGPATGTTLSAKDFRMTVLGPNGGSGGPNATEVAVIGEKCDVRAQLLVPNGTLHLRSRATFLGVLGGRDIEVGQDVRVTFEDGFPAQCGTSPSGWDGNPGSGVGAVLSSISVASEGFDVDGSCRAPGDCAENSLARMRTTLDLALAKAVATGELLVGLERAAPSTSCQETMKLYALSDGPVPNASDNFAIPGGATSCCAFHIDPQSSTGNPAQARVRWVVGTSPTELRSVTPTKVSLPILLDRFDEPMNHGELLIESAVIVATLANGRIAGGRLGGLFLVSDISRIPDWLCQPIGARHENPNPPDCVDAFATAGGPDVDRDGDGLEELQVGASGRVESCFDGPNSCNGACPDLESRRIPPVDATRPESCVASPRLADGYSMAVDFTAVAATFSPAP